VFVKPEQGAPLERASSQIPIPGSPLSMKEIRREEEEIFGRVGVELSTGGHEENGAWHWDSSTVFPDLI